MNHLFVIFLFHLCFLVASLVVIGIVWAILLIVVADLHDVIIGLQIPEFLLFFLNLELPLGFK